tara:strand:+ start:281 stop:1000 length:720 start_codon:yes stop_codon:yes gene_type:complete
MKKIFLIGIMISAFYSVSCVKASDDEFEDKTTAKLKNDSPLGTSTPQKPKAPSRLAASSRGVKPLSFGDDDDGEEDSPEEGDSATLVIYRTNDALLRQRNNSLLGAYEQNEQQYRHITLGSSILVGGFSGALASDVMDAKWKGVLVLGPIAYAFAMKYFYPSLQSVPEITLQTVSSSSSRVEEDEESGSEESLLSLSAVKETSAAYHHKSFLQNLMAGLVAMGVVGGGLYFFSKNDSAS